MTERRNRPAPKMTMNKLERVLQVMLTVADPISLETAVEAGSAAIQHVAVIDAEAEYIRSRELGTVRNALRRALATLTPKEAEAVQESFGLNLVHIAEPVTKTALPALLLPAMAKLRKSPEIRALRPQDIRATTTHQDRSEHKIQPQTSEENRVAKGSNTSSGTLNREIPPNIIEQALLLHRGKLGSRGGLNRTQVCFRLGITKAEFEHILTQHGLNGQKKTG